MHRVFPRLDGQPLVAHSLQGNDLGADFLLGQLLPGDGLVLPVIGAVGAAVDAVVGKVKWCEEHDAVAIESLLDFLGNLIHPLNAGRLLASQKHRRLPMGKPPAMAPRPLFHRTSLFQYLINQGIIVLIVLPIGQSSKYLLMAYKFICFQRFRIIDAHTIIPFKKD